MADPQKQRLQLSEQRRKVDFDTYDVTVDELVRRVERGRIDIAPVYQRQFRWDTTRQSRLVESFLLGIPVPPLFMATNQLAGESVQWEVVDGLQRLLSLVGFVGSDEARKAAGLNTAPLALHKLDKLSTFDNCTFATLPTDIRTALEDRPAKVVVLNDKSDLQVRFDLFERLNTGGVVLTQQEVRECVYRGSFIDLLSQLSSESDFKKVVTIPERRLKDGTPQDFVLRFFAFHERYSKFDHSVRDFLNNFTGDAAKTPRLTARRTTFTRTFRFLAQCFPSSIKSPKGTTAVNLYEAVAVGAALALDRRADIAPRPVNWLGDPGLRKLIGSGTNNRAHVRGRIEFCRDRFLSDNV